MGFYVVFLVFLTFSVRYIVKSDIATESNVIEYLKRIETRLMSLEKRLGSDNGADLKLTEKNPKQEDKNFLGFESMTMEMPRTPEVLSMDHPRGRRAANDANKPGADKPDKRLLRLLKLRRPDLRCLRSNFNRIVTELKHTTRKLSKTNQAIEEIENSMTPIREKLQDLDERLDDDLTEYVKKESLFNIKVKHDGAVTQFYCEKKKDLSKRLRQLCEGVEINSDEMADALQCCESEKEEQLFAPTYKIVPRDKIVDAGDSVSLHCVATAKPNPVMFWSRNSENLFPNRILRDDRFTVYENGTLMIENVAKSDDGIYTCTYVNSQGESRSIARITVIDRVPAGGQCEPLALPLCKDMGYNFTSYPNFLGHKKEEDAGLEIHQFYPIVKVRCSLDLKPFLCSIYAPMCSKEIGKKRIPPCRSLCEGAKAGCEPLMNKFGFEWPQSLQCDRYKSRGGETENNEICLNREQAQPVDKVKIESNVSLHTVPDKIQCEELTVQQCKQVGYTHTFMPNTLNHSTQAEAELQLQTFTPLIDYGCSPDLKFFLCQAYFPMCSGGTYLPVCRSVCERVRDQCQSVLEEFGFEWPRALNCTTFPPRTGSEFCVDTIGGQSIPSLKAGP